MDLTLMICCHNHASYMARMVESIFEQTLSFDKWKVLIIFDECTDGSEDEFLKAWEEQCSKRGLWYLNVGKKGDDEKRVISPLVKGGLLCNVRRRTKKQGLAACKNYGLKHVDTEHVAYLDADDLMLPQRLEIQLNFMRSEAGKYISVCGTNAWDIYPDGRLFVNCFRVGQYQYHHQIEQRIMKENIMCHGSVMARTYDLKDIGFYDTSKEYLGREDWHLWQKMIKRNMKFYNIPERLYIWSAGSSTSR